MLATCLISCNETPEPVGDSDSDVPGNTDPVESDPVESDPVNPDESDPVEDTPVTPTGTTLYVGYAREDITPPEDMLSKIYLTGYAEGRKIEEVESQLYVSCTAFKDAEGDIALIYTLDLHAMTPAQATSLASDITKATKVPKSHIILNVTHNHAAPDTAGTFFSDVITPGVVASAEAAIADLKPCTELYAGEVDMEYYSFIRRYITDDNGKPIAHMAEMDNMVPVARFVREGGKDVVLVNFAAHCDTVSGRAWNTLSGDYVWAFRRVVEHELDCHFSMQLGATGDVNPMTSLDEPNFYGETDNYGKNLGYKIVNEIKNLPKLEIKGNVEAKASTVRVEVDHSTDHLLEKAQEVRSLYYGAEDKGPAEEKMREYGIESIYSAMYIVSRAGKGEFERRNISAVSIGNIMFAAADFEMFATTGRTIKDGGNELYDLTFMCPYSNGMIGYIAADYAFEYNTYEVYSRIYVRGTAEKIAEESIELIKKVAEMQ